MFSVFLFFEMCRPVRTLSKQRNAEYINGLQGLATFFYDDEFDLIFNCIILYAQFGLQNYSRDAAD